VTSIKRAIIRTGLETLYFSGAHRMMQPFFGGVGAILTMHYVRPARPDRFQPNRILEVVPEFLEEVVKRLRRRNVDLVSMDEVHRRLVEGDRKRRFIAFTFDDAYTDHKDAAYRILSKYEVPYIIYVPTSFLDRLGEMWWSALEQVIAKHERIGLVIDGHDRNFDCRTPAEKMKVFEALYWWLRSLPTDEAIRVAVRDLCARYGIDIAAICDRDCMTWDDLAHVAADPLVTIGAHTVNHPVLAKLTEDRVRSELKMSRSVIEAAIGRRPEHFAYPFGDLTTIGTREFRIAKELGFKTAVTTRPGVLFPEHRDHLTALPRLSLNGDYQRQRFVDVLLSGAGSALWNNFKRINAA
jgi:peptidoglycan/xylan/chitin deacetylase (PgdA/CDA1 family)